MFGKPRPEKTFQEQLLELLNEDRKAKEQAVVDTNLQIKVVADLSEAELQAAHKAVELYKKWQQQKDYAESLERQRAAQLHEWRRV